LAFWLTSAAAFWTLEKAPVTHVAPVGIGNVVSIQNTHTEEVCKEIYHNNPNCDTSRIHIEMETLRHEIKRQ
jgi:hypothetical protein